MVPVSKSAYCGSKCHEMNNAYLTWELSPHGTNSLGFRVECIDCHLPVKDRYFAHITAKAYEGAMMAPNYAWWHGFYELKKRCMDIQEEVEELIQNGKPAKIFIVNGSGGKTIKPVFRK
jgi:hypothetical protein